VFQRRRPEWNSFPHCGHRQFIITRPAVHMTMTLGAATIQNGADVFSCALSGMPTKIATANPT
jgi:hypothetical protein